MAHETGALGLKNLARLVVDTNVQPKGVAHPTDVWLMHRANIKLIGSPDAIVSVDKGVIVARWSVSRQAIHG
ncbi:hypothetical protein [Bradyrhizobium huanghuaihaiense]|uniref:hypothetical protein n=1 Tax=Bradyrhizobium huanghuaihaiense TaxID=990078 RepID=UPI003CC67D85